MELGGNDIGAATQSWKVEDKTQPIARGDMRSRQTFGQVLTEPAAWVPPGGAPRNARSSSAG